MLPLSYYEFLDDIFHNIREITDEFTPISVALSEKTKRTLTYHMPSLMMYRELPYAIIQIKQRSRFIGEYHSAFHELFNNGLLSSFEEIEKDREVMRQFMDHRHVMWLHPYNIHQKRWSFFNGVQRLGQRIFMRVIYSAITRRIIDDSLKFRSVELRSLHHNSVYMTPPDRSRFDNSMREQLYWDGGSVWRRADIEAIIHPHFCCDINMPRFKEMARKFELTSWIWMMVIPSENPDTLMEYSLGTDLLYAFIGF